MLAFFVLLVAFAVFRGAGWMGIVSLDGWQPALRAALAVMFLFTATAHWGRGRADLVRMVPPRLPRPDLVVTATGVLEILGAIGLVIPATSRLAAASLAVLLVALFPANVYAARRGLTILGRKATNLPVRTALQVAFILALIAAAWNSP